jgi:ABC-2 type transport system permease protein
MRWLFEVYKAQCRMTIARYLQYRIELHIWLAQIILRPIVFMVVWAAAATAMGGRLHGYTASDFAAYFIIAMLVHHLSLAWLMVEWEPLIKTGDLSYMLLRPNHILHRYIGENLTFKFTTFPFMLIAALVLAVMFKPTFAFSAWSLALALPVLVLAAALFFAITWVMGMMSFFTTAIDSIIVAFFLLMLLFSGQMGPISIAPPAIQAIAKVLPFWWVIGFPTELILGHLTRAQAINGVFIQMGWVSVSVVAMAALWRRGVKSYTAVGI